LWNITLRALVLFVLSFSAWMGLMFRPSHDKVGTLYTETNYGWPSHFLVYTALDQDKASAVQLIPRTPEGSRDEIVDGKHLSVWWNFYFFAAALDFLIGILVSVLFTLLIQRLTRMRAPVSR